MAANPAELGEHEWDTPDSNPVVPHTSPPSCPAAPWGPALWGQQQPQLGAQLGAQLEAQLEAQLGAQEVPWEGGEGPPTHVESGLNLHCRA